MVGELSCRYSYHFGVAIQTFHDDNITGQRLRNHLSASVVQSLPLLHLNAALVECQHDFTLQDGHRVSAKYTPAKHIDFSLSTENCQTNFELQSPRLSVPLNAVEGPNTAVLILQTYPKLEKGCPLRRCDKKTPIMFASVKLMRKPADRCVAFLFSGAVGIFFGFYPDKKLPVWIPSTRCDMSKSARSLTR